ncbi:uncharacterized protein LOC110274237 [Arachis duranensis]|uniref:Uncharacterized protein LOC110274237 n=1 Tax=Arachis duranensis TaxID=130453 RepID=A0A9C6TC75_ARADU|nr:uncharacterized protein LOC112701604 [Arachis hypogaea]XP_052107592.1 uncharacterized protein LOC110274237 [Arachis duranensis]
MTGSSLHPQSELRPKLQATNGSQVTESSNEDIDPEANEVDSFEEHIDKMFAASDAEKRKGQKTTEFWNVDLIDFEGIVKPAKMSVREAMEQSLNGSKIILRFNEELQAVGDGAGLLSGILGALGSDYSKFPIYEKSWPKVWGKDRVYNDCIKAKCKQNALNRKKQLYTHTGGSKSLARTREEESEKQGRKVGRGEVWILKHKRSDGSYIHEEARKIGEKIYEIEQLDESTRILSENDSLAQALDKEHPGRVRGMGHGPTPSQLFRLSLQLSVDRAQVEEAQRMLCELQADVTTEKLKRKAMEDELAAEKMKRQAIEIVLSYLVQQQCGELSLDITAQMNYLDGHGGNRN